jgi:hypothetical protein
MAIGKLKYNHAQAMIDLRLHFIAALTVLQQELLAESQAGMRTPEGRDDLTAGAIKDVAGILSASIIGGPWATMDEFGTGSRLDSDNPFLGDYIRGDTWNPARNDYAIRGRPAGEQPTIFGDRRQFKGNAPGVNLERLAEKGIVGPEFLPQEPSKAIRTAMRWMAQGRFQRVIAGAVQTFPWHKYLIITGAR